MNIIETLDNIVTEQLVLQKLRRESIVSKKEDIIKYGNFVAKEQQRIKEIETEIKEASEQMAKLLEIKHHIKPPLKEENCINT